MNVIQLKNLNIGFNSVLINDINLNLKPGKIVALLGKNGSGKSCFLKTIANLIPCKSGEILINNNNILEFSNIDRAKAVSILLTDKVQLEFLKVEELISLGRSPYTNWKNEFSEIDCKIVDSISEKIGVKKLFGKVFSELSDGQKQKVLLARAIVQNPKLLLLDEPTTFLDIPTKIEFLSTLKSISNDNKIAIILSTHDLLNLKDVCDEYWIVKDQKLTSYTFEELTSSKVLEMEFGLNLN